MQAFTYGLIGARWYEETSLETNIEFEREDGDDDDDDVGQLKIVKNVEFENARDEYLPDTVKHKDGATFNFEVEITRNIRTEEVDADGNIEVKYVPTTSPPEIHTLTIKKGESTGSIILPPEYWDEEAGPPTYRVREIIRSDTNGNNELDPGEVCYDEDKVNAVDWKSVEYTENFIGSFEKDETIEIIATNKYKSNLTYTSGIIQIIKETTTQVEEDTNFYFNLYVRHENGREEKKENIKVTVPAGEKQSAEKDADGNLKYSYQYSWPVRRKTSNL